MLAQLFYYPTQWRTITCTANHLRHWKPSFSLRSSSTPRPPSDRRRSQLNRNRTPTNLDRRVLHEIGVAHPKFAKSTPILSYSHKGCEAHPKFAKLTPSLRSSPQVCEAHTKVADSATLLFLRFLFLSFFYPIKFRVVTGQLPVEHLCKLV